jgi:hypothetical protein
MNLSSENSQALEDGDTPLVEIWLRRDPVRWMAGVLGGVTAGVVGFLVAGVLSKFGGLDLTYPLRIAAMPVVGGMATDLSSGMGPVILGLVIHLGLCAVLGGIFAHFTGTNSMKALLGYGLTWGIFAWIFIFCLFAQSFKDIFAARVPAGPAFFAHIAFGLGLMSVGFFDSAFRRR